MKKKLLSVVLSAAMMVTGACTLTSCNSTANKDEYTVGILQLIQHVALDQANKGFQDKLTSLANKAGKTVKFLDENAAGEQSNNITIAETFVNKKVDLMYAIATSSAQACASASTSIPVVFSSVTDAVGAGLVNSNEYPGGNVTGASDMNPVAKQIDLIGDLLSETTPKNGSTITIGLLYTAAETNSVYQINLAKEECKAKGYNFVDKGIGDANDIGAALSSLTDVDAIYIPTDNVLANAAAQVHSVNSETIKVPIVCGESGMNDVCGVATYGVDYYSLGEVAGQIAYEILVEGKKPADIAVKFDNNPELSLNESVASAIGFSIPSSIKALVK